MNQGKRHAIAVLALLFVAVALAACGGQPNDSTGAADKVTVYVSTDRVFSEPILKAYEQKTGVKVNVVYDTEETKSTGLANKLLAEKSNPQADVFWSNEPVRTLVLKSRGVLAPYKSPNAEGIPATFKDPEAYWTGFSARIRVIVYNTKLVKPEDAPKSIYDLADPKWKDQTAIADPRFGSTSFHVAALYAELGDEKADEFFRRLKANGVKIVPGNSLVRDLVAKGEVKTGLTDTDDVNVALEDNQPVAMVLPDRDGMGAPLMPNMVSLIAGAPHAEAGKKMIDYLLSAEVERGKAGWRLALVVPLVVPPYVLALAWTHLAGAAGLPAEWTYSLSGAAVVLGVSNYPLVMLATEAAARRVEAALEEAALLVAAPRRVATRITLPLIAPAVAAAALVVFVLAVSEFGVPGLLRVNVFKTEVFTAFAARYDFGAATALSAPLLAVTLLAAIAAAALTGEARLTSRHASRTGLPLRLGGWRPLMEALLLLVLFFCVFLPLFALALEAGSLRRFASALEGSGDAVTNSIVLSAIGATLAVALALLPGYARARAKSRRGGHLADLLFIALFAVPGTVVGVGLISLWNRPGRAGAVYTSPLIIVIAYLARFTPVAALLLAAGVRQIPASLEEAAAVAGASWQRTLARIVLPNLKTSLAAAWVVAFIFAFGEIGATILVAPPGESTLPVRIYTLIANTPSGNVAALALVQALIALLPLALLALLIRRREGAR